MNSSDEFSIQQLRRGECTLLVIQGRLDIFTSPAFDDSIDAVERAGGKQIELNLAEVTYIDSTGAGVLVKAYKRLSADGGTLEVIACSPVVHKVLNVLGIMEWLLKKP